MPPQLPPVGPPPLQRGRPTAATQPGKKGYSGGASVLGATGSSRGGGGRPIGATHRELWQHCEAIIESFNAQTDTVDSHTTQYLEKHPALSDSERSFVQQVFYGCSRYRPMLHAVVRKYLSVKARAGGFTSLVMMTYLAMFRVDELGVATFRSLIHGSLSHSRVAEYLYFLFTRSSAEQHFADLWKKVFDDGYVDRVLLGHIDSFADDMLEIAAGFETLASGQEQREKAAAGQGGRGGGGTAKASTVAAPFKLSSPVRKAVVEPEPPPPPPKPKRPVDTVTPAMQSAIEAYRSGRLLSTLSPRTVEENREREARREFQPPKLHALNERPRNLSIVKQKMEDELAEQVRPEFATRPGPDEMRKRLKRQPTEAPKKTAAALLREDAVWRRRDEEAMAALRKKETEMRDDTEFREWQTKMLDADDAAAKASIAQRKVEMMLADEEARAARRRQERKNAREASALKEEIHEKLVKKEEENAAELEHNRQVAAAIREQLAVAVDEQRAKLLEERAHEAKTVREEDRMLELKLAENMELELRRKAEIIRRIRQEAEELKYEIDPESGKRRRKIFKREYDPETTMNMGTLDEMSLVELRAKLSEVQAERSKWRLDREEDIKRQREVKQHEYSEREERVRQRREAEQVQKEAQREHKRREREEQRERQKKREEEQLVALQGKLQERREERQREERLRRQQEQARILQQQYKAADKGAVERKKWQGMESGAERVVKDAQHGRIVDDVVKKQTSVKLHQTREKNTQHAIKDKRLKNIEQKAKFREDMKALEAKQVAESLTLTKSATAERSRRAESSKRVQLQERDVLDALDSLTMPASC